MEMEKGYFSREDRDRDIDPQEHNSSRRWPTASRDLDSNKASEGPVYMSKQLSLLTDKSNESDNEYNTPGVDNSSDALDPEDGKSTSRIKEKVLRSMVTFAKLQGVDLMKQLEEQRRLRQDADVNVDKEQEGKHEMEEMRRLLQERRRSSEEYNLLNADASDTEEGDSVSSKRLRSRSEFRRIDRTGSEVRDASPERPKSLTRSETSTSADYQPDGQDLRLNVQPQQVLDWLQGGSDGINRDKLAVSEDRIRRLLQAITERADTNTGFRDSIGSSLQLEELNWVPAERLNEAKQRSRAAEEQVKRLEEFFRPESSINTGNHLQGGVDDMRMFLTRMRTVERHIAHMKKFIEDKLLDLKKQQVTAEREQSRPWRSSPLSNTAGVNALEMIKRDIHELDNQKKRIMQLSNAWTDLFRQLKDEQIRRNEAEIKVQKLGSQLKRHMAILRNKEKVLIKQAYEISPSFCAKTSSNTPLLRSPMGSGRQTPSMSLVTQPLSAKLSPSNSFRGDDQSMDKRLDASLSRSIRHVDPPHILRRMQTPESMKRAPSNLRSASFPASSFQSHLDHTSSRSKLLYDPSFEQHTLSRDRSPQQQPSDELKLTTSDLIAGSYRREFGDIETALIREGRERGFQDIDLSSEKKISGKEETSWEYRHVHVSFNKPAGTTGSGSKDEAVNSLQGSVGKSRRTVSPSRSEGAAYSDSLPEDHHNPNSAKNLPYSDIVIINPSLKWVAEDMQRQVDMQCMNESTPEVVEFVKTLKCNVNGDMQNKLIRRPADQFQQHAFMATDKAEWIKNGTKGLIRAADMKDAEKVDMGREKTEEANESTSGISWDDQNPVGSDDDNIRPDHLRRSVDSLPEGMQSSHEEPPYNDILSTDNADVKVIDLSTIAAAEEANTYEKEEIRDMDSRVKELNIESDEPCKRRRSTDDHIQGSDPTIEVRSKKVTGDAIAKGRAEVAACDDGTSAGLPHVQAAAGDNTGAAAHDGGLITGGAGAAEVGPADVDRADVAVGGLETDRRQRTAARADSDKVAREYSGAAQRRRARDGRSAGGTWPNRPRPARQEEGHLAAGRLWRKQARLLLVQLLLFASALLWVLGVPDSFSVWRRIIPPPT